MISEAHARAVEQLLPLIEDHDLAVAGQTAAAMYGITARDTSDLLELAAVDAVAEARHSRLKHDLERHLAHHHATLVGVGQHGGRPRPHVDVWRVDEILCAVVTRDDDERPELSIEIGLSGLTAGRACVRPSSLAPGGGRVATVDQVVAAQQVVARWAGAPEDLASTFDLGLAVDRVGPDLAFSHLRTARADEFTTSIERACSLLENDLVTADFVPRARAGLADAQQHLLARCRIDGRRPR